MSAIFSRTRTHTHTYARTIARMWVCAQVEMAEECKAGDATGTYFLQFIKLLLWTQSHVRFTYIVHHRRRAPPIHSCHLKTLGEHFNSWTWRCVFFFQSDKIPHFLLTWCRTMTGINMSRIYHEPRIWICLRCGVLVVVVEMTWFLDYTLPSVKSRIFRLALRINFTNKWWHSRMSAMLVNKRSCTSNRRPIHSVYVILCVAWAKEHVSKSQRGEARDS